MVRWQSLSILFHKAAPHIYPELELLILGDTHKLVMFSVPGRHVESAQEEGAEPPLTAV